MFFKGLLSSLATESMQAAYILNQVEVAHVNEGRIRVVYKALKHDDALYLEICGNLDAINEITDWKINRITGSVTINYDAKRIVKNSFLDKLISGAKARYEG